jgi:hypothetical protein
MFNPPSLIKRGPGNIFPDIADIKITMTRAVGPTFGQKRFNPTVLDRGTAARNIHTRM